MFYDFTFLFNCGFYRLVLSCKILCSTAFCRLSNDIQRRITQRIDIDGAAYRLHGQKLAGRAFSREWNDVDETASPAAAGNRFHSGNDAPCEYAPFSDGLPIKK